MLQLPNLEDGIPRQPTGRKKKKKKRKRKTIDATFRPIFPKLVKIRIKKKKKKD